MTRDEIRNLIGGYATGSLSESERKLLFDAALEDQELFDQLTQEQALKELLEEPGAKQRLLTALGSESVPEKRRLVGWPWALAAAGCLAVVIGVVMLRAPEKPREIAAVAQPVEQETPAIAPQSVAPVAPPVVRLASPKQKSIAAAPRVENAPVALPTPAPAEPSKAEKTAQPSVDAIQEVAVAPAPPQPLANGFVAGRTPQLQGGPIQAQTAGAADAFGKDGGRGGRGGPPSQNAAARAVASRFAFDYSFDSTGALRIVPAAKGYLSVAAPPVVLLPSRNVLPGTPVIVQVPAEATELVVSFSATPAEGAGTPVRRDESAGTVEDQSQRILVTIPVKR